MGYQTVYHVVVSLDIMLIIFLCHLLYKIIEYQTSYRVAHWMLDWLSSSINTYQILYGLVLLVVKFYFINVGFSLRNVLFIFCEC